MDGHRPHPRDTASPYRGSDGLAALATDDAVRAMHCDLASLYRSQLACLVAGDTLMATVAMLGLDLAA